MAKSLQEQLMGAGLVDQKKAKAIKKEKHKKKKQTPKGQVEVDENKVRLEAERKAKVEKDRALNQAKQKEADEKAIVAQIKQLIDLNKIDRKDGELGFNFADGSKVRKIYVTEQQQNQLAKGLISICKFNDDFELVPNKVAEKVAQRGEEFVIKLNIEKEPDEDDPYAKYVIPDDLMW